MCLFESELCFPWGSPGGGGRLTWRLRVSRGRTLHAVLYPAAPSRVPTDRARAVLFRPHAFAATIVPCCLCSSGFSGRHEGSVLAALTCISLSPAFSCRPLGRLRLRALFVLVHCPFFDQTLFFACALRCMSISVIRWNGGVPFTFRWEVGSFMFPNLNFQPLHKACFWGTPRVEERVFCVLWMKSHCGLPAQSTIGSRHDLEAASCLAPPWAAVTAPPSTGPQPPRHTGSPRGERARAAGTRAGQLLPGLCALLPGPALLSARP